MNEQTIRVLLLDDEESLRKHLSVYLRDTHGLTVDTVADGNAAMRLIEEMEGHYDVALLDEALPEGPSGLEVLRAIKARYPEIEVILFTGWGREAGMEALHAGAYRFFTKLVDKDELAMTIRFAAEQKRLRQERDYMASLVKTSRLLTQATQRDEQLNLVWDFVREQLEVSTFWIALYDPVSDTLDFPIVYDQNKSVHRDSRFLGQDKSMWGLAGYVVKTAQEVLWSSYQRGQDPSRTFGIYPLQVGNPAQSCFSIPLQTKSERVLGAISIQSYQQNAFDPALLNAVRALGNQLVVALENSRLLNETEQKARNLDALQNLAIAINSTLDLTQVLSRTCQAAVELSGADHSGLVLFEPDLETGKVIAEYPATERTLEQIITVRGIPTEERLVFEQQVINIPDLANDTSLGPVRDLFTGLGIRSVLIVPVIFGGRVVASFSIDAIQKPRAFSQSDIEICQSLANQVAVAIRNARLYEETCQGHDYLRSLYQATTEIISPRDPGEVLQNIVETACRTTGAWRAATLLIGASGRPRALASFGFDHRLDIAEGARPDGISIRVVRSGESQFIPDTKAEADKVNPAMLAQGCKAAVCLPLKLLGKNIGVLWLQFRDKHTFSETEQQALQLYANQSAIAYDNARRMQELEQLRIAADAIASHAEWREVLLEIAESAKQVLEADYVLIWPYDAERKIFFPEDLVAEGIPDDLLEEFRKEEPHAGSTTEHVLQSGYVSIDDIHSPQAEFVGATTRDLLNTFYVKSFQSIRLDVAGEPLGVLFANYKHTRGFAEEDRRILEHFASHAALTLKKARLFEQVRRSHAAARAVAQVSTLGDLDKTLNATVEGALAVLHCDIATVYSFDEENQRFAQPIGTGCHDRRNLCPPNEVNSSPDSAPWRIIRLQDKLYHLSEYALDDELLDSNFIKAEGVQSALGIQLRFSEHRVGVMFINYRTPHRFTEDEIKDALQFANQAAVAIHNARLHDEVRKRAEVMQGLYEAGKAITSTLSLEETLNHIAEQALYIVGADYSKGGCFSHIALREGDKLRFVAAWPPEMLNLLQSEFELDLTVDPKIGIQGRAIKTAASQNVSDISPDPDYVQIGEGIKSQLSVPIMIGIEAIGVVSVEHPRVSAFAEEDVKSLELLAAQAAVAISNAQLYGKTTQELAARTALAWTGMVSSTWRHAIEKHAITIREQIQLLRFDVGDRANADAVGKRLEMVERLANQILEKPLTPPLSTEEGVHSLPINDLLRERTRQLWMHEPYNSVSLRLDLKLQNSQTLRASPEWLRRAVDILIENAVEATSALPERKIAICSQRRDDYTEISIADNGRGIPPQVLEQLFREPIKKPQGAKGQGIGLLLAQTIIQTYGGSIHCRETGSTGTTMVVSLPLEI